MKEYSQKIKDKIHNIECQHVKLLDDKQDIDCKYIYFIDDEYGVFKKRVSKLYTEPIRHPKRGALETQRKLSKSLEEVKCALPSYLSIVDETYTKSNAKALFIDKEYGEYNKYLRNSYSI